jgi:hypothetical protein
MKIKISKLKLLNYKKYRGIGRPRIIDYDYFKTYEQFIVALIGPPINPNLPVPIGFDEILKWEED